ncbi:MAG: hypothetical protein ACI4O7_02515 [Aristaeellaceae bacterium]
MYINLNALAGLACEYATFGHCSAPAEVHVSAHALQRFRERTGMTDADEIQHFVNEAVRVGRGFQSFSGAYRQFMLEKAHHGYWPIACRGLLLVLSPDRTTVVTVYPLPEWFIHEPAFRSAPGERFPDRGGRRPRRFRGG